MKSKKDKPSGGRANKYDRQPARTVGPLPFGNLEGATFERLVYAYLRSTRSGTQWSWLGESGGDEGVDILGTELTSTKPGRATRTTLVLCANHRQVSQTKLLADLSRALGSHQTAVDEVLYIGGGRISAKARKNAELVARAGGVEKTTIWSGAEFEESLRHEASFLVRRFLEGEVFEEDEIGEGTPEAGESSEHNLDRSWISKISSSQGHLHIVVHSDLRVRDSRRHKLLLYLLVLFERYLAESEIEIEGALRSELSRYRRNLQLKGLEPSSLPQSPHPQCLAIYLGPGAPAVNLPRALRFYENPVAECPFGPDTYRFPLDRVLLIVLLHRLRSTSVDRHFLRDLSYLPEDCQRLAYTYLALDWPECSPGEPLLDNRESLVRSLEPPISDALRVPHGEIPSPGSLAAEISEAINRLDLTKARELIANSPDPQNRDDPRLLLLRSRLELLSGNHSEAVSILRSAQQASGDPEIACGLALLAAGHGEYTEARSIINNLERTHVVVTTQIYIEALDRVRQSGNTRPDLDKSILELEELTKQGKLCTPFGLLTLAEIFQMAGRYDEALSMLENAIALRPDIVELQIRRALLVLERFPSLPLDPVSEVPTPLIDRYPRMAIAWLEDLQLRTVKSTTEHMDGFLLRCLGIAYYCAGFACTDRERRQKDFKMAAEHFSSAHSLDPSNVSLLGYAGECLLHSGDYPSSLAALSAIPKEQRSTAVSANLASGWLQLGYADRALRELEPILSSGAVHAQSLANLGLMLVASGHPESALTALTIARPGLGPLTWKADFLRGRALLDLRRYSSAEISFRDAISGNSYSTFLYGAHLEAFLRSTVPALKTILRTDAAETLRQSRADSGPCRRIDALLDKTVRRYRALVTKYRHVFAHPSNGLSGAFRELRSEIDHWNALNNQLDLLKKSHRFDARTLVVVLNAFLSPQNELDTGLSIGTTAFDPPLSILASSRRHHEAIVSEFCREHSWIRVGELGIEVLAQLMTGQFDHPEAAWIHQRSREIDVQSESAALRAYNVTSGINRKAYQENAVRRVVLQHHGRSLLADEVGLGKTIEACLVLAEYYLRGLLDSVLVLVPTTNLGSQWEAELRSKFHLPLNGKELTFRYIPGRKLRAGRALITIITYNAAISNKQLLRSSHWDMVICDEAHYLRNRGSQRHRLVKQLESQYLLLLTATPIQNRVEDLYSLTNLLRPGLFGTLRDFSAMYRVTSRSRSIQNISKLAAKLDQVLVRHQIRAVTAEAQIVRRRFHDTSTALSSEERMFYDKVQDLVLQTDERTVNDALPLAYYRVARAACSSPAAVRNSLLNLSRNARLFSRRAVVNELIEVTDSLPPRAKLAALEDVVEQLAGESVIVFTEYHSTAAQIATALGGLYFPKSATHSQVDRDLSRFLEGKGPRVLVATPRFTEGLNLERCRNIVNFDLPWNPYKIEQRIGRVHRFGQSADEVRVFTICGTGTIEDLIREVLLSKLRAFEQALGAQSFATIEFGDGEELEQKIRRLLTQAKSRGEIVDLLAELAAELRPTVTHDPSLVSGAGRIGRSMMLLDDELRRRQSDGP